MSLICLVTLGSAVAPTAADASGVIASVQSPTSDPEIPVTVVDIASADANNSPAIAVDPTEPRFVALASRIDAPDFGCALNLSGTAGRSWVPALPVPGLPPKVEKCHAPEVAFDGDGTLYYLFVGLADAGNTPVGAFLTTSSVRGHSFSPPRQVLGPNSFMVRMAVDTSAGSNGRLHLVWLAPDSEPTLGGFPSGDNPIRAVFSDDGGRTFSNPVRVSDPQRRRSVAPALALGTGDAVHVAYYDLQDDAVDYQGLEGPTWPGTWSLVVSSSLDGGAGFGPGSVVDAQLVPPERVMLIFTMTPPALVADGAGALFASWYDARHGDWDVFLARSGDRGNTGKRPAGSTTTPRATAAISTCPGSGWPPTVGLTPSSTTDATTPKTWTTTCRSPLRPTGGESFAPSMQLTAFPSSSMIGARYPIPSAIGLVEFGSRLALMSGETKALAAWTDTRNSLSGEQQDIFATEVAFGEEEAGAEGAGNVSSTWVVAGGVLLATIGLLTWRRAQRRRRPGGDASAMEEFGLSTGPEEGGN